MLCSGAISPPSPPSPPLSLSLFACGSGSFLLAVVEGLSQNDLGAEAWLFQSKRTSHAKTMTALARRDISIVSQQMQSKFHKFAFGERPRAPDCGSKPARIRRSLFWQSIIRSVFACRKPRAATLFPKIAAIAPLAAEREEAQKLSRESTRERERTMAAMKTMRAKNLTKTRVAQVRQATSLPGPREFRGLAVFENSRAMTGMCVRERKRG